MVKYDSRFNLILIGNRYPLHHVTAKRTKATGALPATLDKSQLSTSVHQKQGQ